MKCVRESASVCVCSVDRFTEFTTLLGGHQIISDIFIFVQMEMPDECKLLSDSLFGNFIILNYLRELVRRFLVRICYCSRVARHTVNALVNFKLISPK